MKIYKLGDIVELRSDYIKILDIDNLVPAYTKSWTSYMASFKSYYKDIKGLGAEGLTTNDIRTYESDKYKITNKHQINVGNDSFYYYSTVNVESGLNCPIYFIPEFFKDYYHSDVLDTHKELVFKQFCHENLISMDKEPDVNLKSNIGDKIKLPAFKHEAWKYIVFDTKSLNTVKKVGFKFYDKNVLCLIDDKFVKEKVHSWLNKLNNEELIIEFAKAKIKDYSKSADIFGYKPSKKEMFESGNTFKIEGLRLDYESKKTKTKLDVIELHNGEKSLKFLLEDVELIFNEPKGFNIPTKINITKCKKPDIIGKSVRIIRDKGLPIKRNDKATIVELWNSHQPVTGNRFSLREVNYDKNSKIKIKLENSKTITCKLKNIKFVK